MAGKKPIPFPQSTRLSAQLPRNHGVPKKRPPRPKKAKPAKAPQESKHPGRGIIVGPTLEESQEKAVRMIAGEFNRRMRFFCRKCGAKKNRPCVTKSGNRKASFCRGRGEFAPVPTPSLIEWFEGERRKKKARKEK